MHRMFACRSPAVIASLPVRFYGPVAWNKKSDGIGYYGIVSRKGGFASAHGFGDSFVMSQCARSCCQQGAPHRDMGGQGKQCRFNVLSIGLSREKID